PGPRAGLSRGPAARGPGARGAPAPPRRWQGRGGPGRAVLFALRESRAGPAHLADGALGGRLDEHEVADVELEVFRNAVIVGRGRLAKPDADEKVVHGFHPMPLAGRAGSAGLRA